MGVSVTSNLFHASLSLLNLGKPVLNTDPGAATALLQQNCHSLSFSSPLFPSWTAGEQSPAQALLQPRNIQSLCCPQNLGASFKPRTSHLQSGARCPQTTTGTGTVPTSKAWLTHGCCILGSSVLLCGCCQSSVALLPHPKPLLCCAEGGKPEAALQLGLELAECGVLPMEREGRQSCSTGYSTQKPFLRFLALFRAKELEAGGAPLTTALRQGCPALAPHHCLGVQPPVLRAGDFSHPHPLLCSASWPNPVAWSFPRHDHMWVTPSPSASAQTLPQPLLCPGDAKDSRLWHRRAGEVCGQAKGCGQAGTGGLGLQGRFFSWAGLIPAACISGWLGSSSWVTATATA